MTTEEKNNVLELHNQHKSVRQIVALTGLKRSTVSDFILANEGVEYFSICPGCGNEIIHLKIGKGRKRIYCSNKCKHSKKAIKNLQRICLNCGRSFLAWKYSKNKYCCHSCYVEHRYGKRLQDKSS